MNASTDSSRSRTRRRPPVLDDDRNHCNRQTRLQSCVSCWSTDDRLGSCSVSDSSNERLRSSRKSRTPRRGLLIVSAVALSMNSVDAFQCALPPSLRLAQHFDGAHTQNFEQFVVTDPNQLLQTEMDDPDRPGFSLEALEDLYMQSPDMASTRFIETELGVKKQKRKPKPAIRSIKSSTTAGVQSKSSLPQRKRDSLKATTNPPVVKSGRSSTMPGFASRGISDKRRAHMESVAFVEQTTGRKLSPAQSKYTNENMYSSSSTVPDSMVQFASDIHKIDRITAKEEKILGALTQEAIRLQNLHDDLAERLKREPSDEEWCAAAGKINIEALSQAIDEGLAAKNKLVTSNLRMVQGVVNVYIRNGLGTQYNAGDLMQEGVMALVRAAEKFDPSRGFRFSTYAMYWIRAAIKRAQLFQSRIITIPPRLHETHKRILRTEVELKGSLNRQPTKEEVGEIVGMNADQIDRCKRANAQRCYSLDQTISNKNKIGGNDDGATMYDIVATRFVETDESVQHQFLREDLIAAMSRVLPPLETKILMMRYGLGEFKNVLRPGKNVTIAELGLHFGLRPDKVRRIINKSLKKLKARIGDEWRHFEQDLP